MSTDDRVRSYTSAFYEAVLERWQTALNTVAGTLAADRELSERLQAIGTEFDQRQKLLDRILPDDTDLPVRNLLYTMAQHGDLELLADVSDALHQRMSEAARTAPVRVEVVSAMPMTAEQRQALLTKLEAQYGSGLDVHYRVDPSILGGLVVRVGDKLIDGSLATRLAAMRQALGVSTGE